jgi:hypothetical protein
MSELPPRDRLEQERLTLLDIQRDASLYFLQKGMTTKAFQALDEAWQARNIGRMVKGLESLQDAGFSKPDPEDQTLLVVPLLHKISNECYAPSLMFMWRTYDEGDYKLNLDWVEVAHKTGGRVLL